MEDQLRFAVCYWHSFAWNGFDVFGYDGSFERPWHRMADPWEAALAKADAAFDFFTRLGAPFYCFHDRDVAPEGSTPQGVGRASSAAWSTCSRASSRTAGMKLLWGTANLFSHRRFIAGAATNPESRGLRARRAAGQGGDGSDAAARRRELRAVGRPRGLRDAAQYRPQAASWRSSAASCRWSSSTSTRSASRARS